MKNVSELDDIPAKPRNKDGAGSSSSGSDAGSDAPEKVPEVKMVGMAEMVRAIISHRRDLPPPPGIPTCTLHITKVLCEKNKFL